MENLSRFYKELGGYMSDLDDKLRDLLYKEAEEVGLTKVPPRSTMGV